MGIDQMIRENSRVLLPSISNRLGRSIFNLPSIISLETRISKSTFDSPYGFALLTIQSSLNRNSNIDRDRTKGIIIIRE